MVPERHSEDVAQILLATILPGSVVKRRDMGTGRSVHDFDLVREGKIISAVEVTSTVSQAVMEAQKVLETKGYHVPARTVTGRWTVFVEPHSMVRGRTRGALFKSLDKLLGVLESEGVFQSGHHDPENPELKPVLGELARLGVVYWDCVRKAPGKIIVLSSGRGVFVSSEDYVNPAVERLAMKPDNRCKLQASGAPERYLFIVVDERTDHRLWKQMTEYTPPSAAPALPPEITGVWVAALRREGGYVVWQATRATGWADLRLAPGT